MQHDAGTDQKLPANVSALCISGNASSLLSTHPPVEKRIDRLEAR